jgi:uridine kinase
VTVDELVRRLASLIDVLGATGRSVVAFDGPDASGKTTLADRVAALTSVAVCRASVDGFHAPAAARQRRGDLSPEGYYRDSFDYAALDERLLAPFLAGAVEVCTGAYDFRADSELPRAAAVPQHCVLLLDGVFLLRPELRAAWTLSVYLDVSEEQVLARACRRDAELFGSEAAVLQRYRRRYLPGQAIYRAEAQPRDHADIVIDNEDPSHPRVLRWPAS